jgi:hypothetical protein
MSAMLRRLIAETCAHIREMPNKTAGDLQTIANVIITIRALVGGARMCNTRQSWRELSMNLINLQLKEIASGNYRNLDLTIRKAWDDALKQMSVV